MATVTILASDLIGRPAYQNAANFPSAQRTNLKDAFGSISGTTIVPKALTASFVNDDVIDVQGWEQAVISYRFVAGSTSGTGEFQIEHSWDDTNFFIDQDVDGTLPAPSVTENGSFVVDVHGRYIRVSARRVGGDSGDTAYVGVSPFVSH